MESLSARRAWIEISTLWHGTRAQNVALRKESVDRNPPQPLDSIFHAVVALRKESVDRNLTSRRILSPLSTSLSARRAWIEIILHIEHPLLAVRRSPQGERG